MTRTEANPRSLPLIERIEADPCSVIAIIEEGFRTREALADQSRMTDFSGLYFLITQSKYTRGIISPDLLGQCRLVYEDWEDIFWQKVEVIFQRYSLQREASSPKDFFAKILDSDYDTATKIYDEAKKLQFSDSATSDLLRAQQETVEEVLKYLTPQFANCQPENLSSETITPFDQVFEPKSLKEALDLARENYFATCNTTLAYTEKDRTAVMGGFGKIYLLLEREGFFSDLLPPQLIEQSRQLTVELNALRANSLRKALLLSWGIDAPEGKDSRFYQDMIKDFSPEAQDKVAAQFFENDYEDDQLLSHFARRKTFEEGVIDFLIKLESPEGPKPTDKRQLLEIVITTHEFTGENVETFLRRDAAGFTGGYKFFYSLLEGGMANQYMSRDLVEEGLQIMKEWQIIKDGAFREAVRITWGIDLNGVNLQKFLLNMEKPVNTNYLPHQKRAMERRARLLALADPRSLQHFQRQIEYEERVIDVLS